MKKKAFVMVVLFIALVGCSNTASSNRGKSIESVFRVVSELEQRVDVTQYLEVVEVYRKLTTSREFAEDSISKLVDGKQITSECANSLRDELGEYFDIIEHEHHEHDNSWDAEGGLPPMMFDDYGNPIESGGEYVEIPTEPSSEDEGSEEGEIEYRYDLELTGYTAVDNVIIYKYNNDFGVSKYYIVVLNEEGVINEISAR